MSKLKETEPPVSPLRPGLSGQFDGKMDIDVELMLSLLQFSMLLWTRPDLTSLGSWQGGRVGRGGGGREELGSLKSQRTNLRQTTTGDNT